MLHWGWRTWTREFPGQGTWSISAFLQWYYHSILFNIILFMMSWQDHHVDVVTLCHFDILGCCTTSQDPGCSKITHEDIVEYVSSKPNLDFLGVAWRQVETCKTVDRLRRTFTADKVRPEQSQCQVAAMLSAQDEISPGKDRKCKNELSCRLQPMIQNNTHSNI